MNERKAQARPGPVPLERLRIEPMANGWRCILLTESIGWEEFPDYASAIARMVGGRLGLVLDGPDIRMRGLWLGLRRFWIVFDDFPFGVTIEPRSRRADDAIGRLHGCLDGLRRRPKP